MYDPEKKNIEGIVDKISKTWHGEILKRGPYRLHVRDGKAEYESVDGMGTKGLLHWQARSFENAALDALAMNLNDMAVVGIKPLSLSAHLMLQEDDKEAIERVTNKLIDYCNEYEIEYLAGDTAIMDTIQGLEVGLSLWGEDLVENVANYNPKVGDVLIGIESNGLHSNGLTFVRIVRPKLKIDKDELIKPTHIYLPTILDILKEYKEGITAMHHITGGAFTRLKHVADEAKGRVIISHHKLNPQGIFIQLNKYYNDRQMLSTFNCGIGYVIVANPDSADDIRKKIPFKTDLIGKIHEGEPEVVIYSPFSTEVVTFKRIK